MIRTLLTGRPTVAIAAAVVAYGFASGWVKGRALDACRSQWIDAGNTAQLQLLENERDEMRRANDMLRRQASLLAEQRDREAEQKEREKAAKWRARQVLDALRDTPEGESFLVTEWPTDAAEWVCGSTGYAAGCADENGVRRTDDTDGVHSPDGPMRRSNPGDEREGGSVLPEQFDVNRRGEQARRTVARVSQRD